MSIIIPDCFDHIIGLSRTECECFTVPAEANESLSGLFLDETEDLNLRMADAGVECTTGSLWDMLSRSRDNGIKQFKADLLSGLTGYYKKRDQEFTGTIGDVGFRKNITPAGTYLGLSVYTRAIRGGQMKVKRIGAAFSQTGSFDIDIYNDLEDGSIETVTVNTTANKMTWTELPTPIYLPMTNDSGGSMRYDFALLSADMPGQPKDTRVLGGCGCNGKKNYYNVVQPRYTSISTASSRWMNFVMAAGFRGNDVSTPLMRDVLTHDQTYSNGLVLDVEFICDLNDLLCQAVSNFGTGNISLAMAKAVQYISAAFVCGSILSSGNINFYTMSDRERIMGKKNSYVKEYNYRLNEIIIPQFNIEGNDCLVCDTSGGPTKQLIRA
jgi:hypothetical protein